MKNTAPKCCFQSFVEDFTLSRKPLKQFLFVFFYTQAGRLLCVSWPDGKLMWNISLLPRGYRKAIEVGQQQKPHHSRRRRSRQPDETLVERASSEECSPFDQLGAVVPSPVMGAALSSHYYVQASDDHVSSCSGLMLPFSRHPDGDMCHLRSSTRQLLWESLSWWTVDASMKKARERNPESRSSRTRTVPPAVEWTPLLEALQHPQHGPLTMAKGLPQVLSSTSTSTSASSSLDELPKDAGHAAYVPLHQSKEQYLEISLADGHCFARFPSCESSLPGPPPPPSRQPEKLHSPSPHTACLHRVRLGLVRETQEWQWVAQSLDSAPPRRLRSCALRKVTHCATQRLQHVSSAVSSELEDDVDEVSGSSSTGSYAALSLSSADEPLLPLPKDTALPALSSLLSQIHCSPHGVTSVLPHAAQEDEEDTKVPSRVADEAEVHHAKKKEKSFLQDGAAHSGIALEISDSSSSSSEEYVSPTWIPRPLPRPPSSTPSPQPFPCADFVVDANSFPKNDFQVGQENRTVVKSRLTESGVAPCFTLAELNSRKGGAPLVSNDDVVVQAFLLRITVAAPSCATDPLEAVDDDEVESPTMWYDFCALPIHLPESCAQKNTTGTTRSWSEIEGISVDREKEDVAADPGSVIPLCTNEQKDNAERCCGFFQPCVLNTHGAFPQRVAHHSSSSCGRGREQRHGFTWKAAPKATLALVFLVSPPLRSTSLPASARRHSATQRESNSYSAARRQSHCHHRVEDREGSNSSSPLHRGRTTTGPSSVEGGLPRVGVPYWGDTPHSRPLSRSSSALHSTAFTTLAKQGGRALVHNTPSSRVSPHSLVLSTPNYHTILPHHDPSSTSTVFSSPTTSVYTSPRSPHPEECVSFFEVNFEPLRLLGRGASGAAILVRHRMSGKLYAVKVLLVQDYESEKDVLQEVRVHASLECKYLVQYHSSWSEVITPQRAQELASIGLLPRQRPAAVPRHSSKPPLTPQIISSDGVFPSAAGSPFSFPCSTLSARDGLSSPNSSARRIAPRYHRAGAALRSTSAVVSPRLSSWSFLLEDVETCQWIGVDDTDSSSDKDMTEGSTESCCTSTSNSSSFSASSRSSDETGAERDRDDRPADGAKASTMTSLMDMRVVFIQMQVCQLTLAERLGARTTIDRIENLVVLIQLCSGLIYLHDRGILHRDVKPTNVFLDFRCRLSERADGNLSPDELDSDDDAPESGVEIYNVREDNVVHTSDGAVHLRQTKSSAGSLYSSSILKGGQPFRALYRSASAPNAADENSLQRGTALRNCDGLYCASLARLPQYCNAAPLRESVPSFVPSFSLSPQPVFSLPSPWLGATAAAKRSDSEPSREEISALLRSMREGPPEDTKAFIRDRSQELMRKWEHRLRELSTRTSSSSSLYSSVHHHGSKLLATWLLRHLVHVRLGDFGLAKLHSQQQPKLFDGSKVFSMSDANTQGVGSPLYASPEQLRGDLCTAASDVFSLAILMVEMYLLPSTIAERLDVLHKTREGLYPTNDVVRQFPELAVIPLLTQQNPMVRHSARALRRHLFGMLQKCLEAELESYFRSV